MKSKRIRYHRMFEAQHVFNYTPSNVLWVFQPIMKSGHVGGAHPVHPELSQASLAIGRKRFRPRQKLEGGRQYER